MHRGAREQQQRGRHALANRRFRPRGLVFGQLFRAVRLGCTHGGTCHSSEERCSAGRRPRLLRPPCGGCSRVSGEACRPAHGASKLEAMCKTKEMKTGRARARAHSMRTRLAQGGEPVAGGVDQGPAAVQGPVSACIAPPKPAWLSVARPWLAELTRDQASASTCVAGGAGGRSRTQAEASRAHAAMQLAGPAGDQAPATMAAQHGSSKAVPRLSRPQAQQKILAQVAAVVHSLCKHAPCTTLLRPAASEMPGQQQRQEWVLCSPAPRASPPTAA